MIFKHFFARKFSQLSRMTRHQRGAISVMTAVSMPVMFGVLALSVDISYALSDKNILQGVADNAARAGAQINSQSGATKAMVIAEVCGIAASHGYYDKTYCGHSQDNVDINVNLVADGIAGSFPMSSFAVEVTIAKPSSQFFGALGTMVASMRARAVADYSFLPCLAALNTACGSGTGCPSGAGANAETGITLSGNNTTLIAECPVYSNRSSQNWSIKTDGGSASIKAKAVYMVGNAAGQNVISDNIKADQAAYVNPFKPLVDAIPTSQPIGTTSQSLNCASSYDSASQAVVLQPGYYASGMKFGNNFFTGLCANSTKVVMQPGVYYLKDDFSINSPVPIEALGVTFVLMGNSEFVMKGGNIQISPKMTGEYAMMSVIGGGTGSGSGIWSSSSSFDITGNIVLPNKTFTMSGNVATGPNCMTIIANSISASGMSGTISGGCPTVNGNPNTVRAAGLIL